MAFSQLIISDILSWTKAGFESSKYMSKVECKLFGKKFSDVDTQRGTIKNEWENISIEQTLLNVCKVDYVSKSTWYVYILTVILCVFLTYFSWLVGLLGFMAYQPV